MSSILKILSQYCIRVAENKTKILRYLACSQVAWFKSYAFFSAGAARHPFRPGRPRNREKRKKPDITSPRSRFLVHNTISYLPHTTVCKCYTPYILAYIQGVRYLIQYTLSVLNNIVLHFNTFPLLTSKYAFSQLLVVGLKK